MVNIEGTQQPFDKSKQSNDNYFVKMPSDLMYYVHVPGYKPEYNYLYTVLVDFYNVNQGYAYPTEWQIGQVYGGYDPKTIRKHLNVLKSVGLIGIYKPYNNKIYVPFKPLPKEELFKVCPEAKANYEAYLQKEAEEKQRKALEEVPEFLRGKIKLKE